MQITLIIEKYRCRGIEKEMQSTRDKLNLIKERSYQNILTLNKDNFIKPIISQTEWSIEKQIRHYTKLQKAIVLIKPQTKTTNIMAK